MTRSMGIRRATLLVGTATVATLALSGCAAGQIAETANKQPSIYGVNTENADGSVLIRSLAVAYPGVDGYPAGGSAPLEVALVNETTQPITVRISSQPPRAPQPQLAYAKNVTVGAAPTAAAKASPATAPPSPAGAQASPPAAKPSPANVPTAAAITLAPLSSAMVRPGQAQQVNLVGLSQAVRPGHSVNVVFEFSNGVAPLEVPAGVAVPLSPAPRMTPAEPAGEGGH